MVRQQAQTTEIAGMPDQAQILHTEQAPIPWLWAYSPFAFASPALERLYQEYHATHFVHYALILYIISTCQCVAEGVVARRGDYASYVLPNLMAIVAVDLAALSLLTWAPHVFRRHAQLCGVLWDIAHMFTKVTTRSAWRMMYINNIHPPPATSPFQEHILIWVMPLRILCTPYSLPVWLVMEVLILMFWLPSGADLCRVIGGPEGRGLPAALRRVLFWNAPMHALGSGPIPPAIGCGIRLLFWDIQAGALKGVGDLLRDVWWRRAFLKAHPHLIGPDGPALAAKWPLGAPHMVSMCMVLIVAFAMWSFTVTDVMLSIMLQGVKAGVVGGDT